MRAGRTQITTRLNYLGTGSLVFHCLWLHPGLADHLSHISPVPGFLGWHMVTHTKDSSFMQTRGRPAPSPVTQTNKARAQVVQSFYFLCFWFLQVVFSFLPASPSGRMYGWLYARGAVGLISLDWGGFLWTEISGRVFLLLSASTC